MSYMIGNIIGRLITSYLLVWLACFFIKKYRWRLAFGLAHSWKGWLGTMLLFGLGLLSATANAQDTQAVKVLSVMIYDQGNRTRPITAFIHPDQDRVFVDESEEDTTYLLHWNKQSMDVVNHAEKETSPLPLGMLPGWVSDDRLPPLTVSKTNVTETIAGHKVFQYQIASNKTLCGQVYLSQSALELPGLKDLVDLSRRMRKPNSLKKIAKSLGYKADKKLCVYVEEFVFKRLLSKGLPLKLIRDGQVLFEVVSIEPNQIADERMFQLPSDYTHYTFGQMWEKQIKKAQAQ